MKVNVAPVVAAVLLMSTSVVPSWAQLPPCNMGKSVHQPGDNQYMPSSQMERHGTTYMDRTGPGGSVFVTRGGAGGGGPVPGMAPMAVNPIALMGSNAPKVDVSLEPISADEPVPPPGFPPLPERLQLPISQSSSWNGGRGGSGPRGGGGSPVQGVHEHYVHLTPGMTSGGGGSSGGGGGGGGYSGPGDDAVPGAGGSSIGGAGVTAQAPAAPPSHYYKCGAAPSPNIHRNFGGQGDTFNSNPGGPAAPRYTGASSRDLRSLGRAPQLDDRSEGPSAPEAPQAATVTQSTTQDLSLPDDEFASRYGLHNSPGKSAARFAGRMLRTGVYSGIGRVYSLVP